MVKSDQLTPKCSPDIYPPPFSQPPELRILFGLQIWSLQVTLLPHPTSNLEHFWISELVTSNHPLPPSLMFLDFKFSYLKSHPHKWIFSWRTLT